MPLLFMSHKFLYLALCSSHSVLIFDNYISPMVLVLIFSADFPQVSSCINLTIISKLMLYRFHNSHPMHILWETWIFCFPYDSPIALDIQVQSIHSPFPSCHILSLAKPCSASGRSSFTFCSLWLRKGGRLHYFFFHVHLVFGSFPPCTAESILCTAIWGMFQSKIWL